MFNRNRSRSPRSQACAMEPLTAPVLLLSMLLASALAYADEQDQAYADFGRPDDSARVTGANDIYRAKIHDVSVVTSDDSPRDPFYIYDMDAWTMVSSGPIIGPYRNRAYSLFGSGLEDPPLNALTMRSEYLRSNVGMAMGSPASWSYAGWRF
jgi:hypothetical protein